MTGPVTTTYSHAELEFTVSSDASYFTVTMRGRPVGQLQRPRVYSREGWTFTTRGGKQLTKHAFLGAGSAQRMHKALMKWNGGCTCCETQLTNVGCDCEASPLHELKETGAPVHARTAATAEQVAQLDDQSVLLRYRQLSARLHATGRGTDEEVRKRDLFAAEAKQRNLI